MVIRLNISADRFNSNFELILQWLKSTFVVIVLTTFDVHESFICHLFSRCRTRAAPATKTALALPSVRFMLGSNRLPCQSLLATLAEYLVRCQRFLRGKKNMRGSCLSREEKGLKSLRGPPETKPTTLDTDRTGFIAAISWDWEIQLPHTNRARRTTERKDSRFDSRPNDVTGALLTGAPPSRAPSVHISRFRYNKNLFIVPHFVIYDTARLMASPSGLAQ